MSGLRPAAVFASLCRAWKLWIGVVGLLVMVLWTGGACTDKVRPGTVEGTAGALLPPGAELLTVSNETVTTLIDVVGTVESEEKIHLRSRVSAYVKEVSVSAGDSVTAGQLLIALDDRELREQLTAAEAQLKQAETEFNRARRLLETNATTEQAFDAAESAFRGARANVEGTKVMLSYTRITAPIDGRVTDRRVEAGDLADPGQLLLAVYDPVNMRVEAAVPVRLIEKLAKGQVLDVHLERPQGTFRGQVTEIVGEIDPLSRTQRVRVRLLEAAEGVLPGTFARIWVAEGAHDAVLVPAAAVHRAGQLESVHVVQGEGTVQRLVKTGRRYGERLEILSGLAPGTTIVAQSAREE